MASRPELTKASYIDTRINPALAHSRIDTTGLASDMELARKFEAEDDAFVKEQTTVKPEVSLWGLGWRGAVFIVKNIRSLVRIYSLIRKAFPMQNWKTTISGVLTAGVIVLKMFGLEIPQPVQDGVLAVSVFLVGLFAKDSSKPAEQPKQ